MERRIKLSTYAVFGEAVFLFSKHIVDSYSDEKVSNENGALVRGALLCESKASRLF